MRRKTVETGLASFGFCLAVTLSTLFVGQSSAVGAGVAVSTAGESGVYDQFASNAASGTPVPDLSSVSAEIQSVHASLGPAVYLWRSLV